MELLNCMLKKLNYRLQLLELLNMFLNFECFIRMIRILLTCQKLLSAIPTSYSPFSVATVGQKHIS